MRWLAILAITFAAFTGCSLADALENAPCESDDDCLGQYTCVKTVHAIANALTGVCRDDGKCVAGEQEGCISSAGSCTDFNLTVVTDESTGATYCCDTLGAADATVAMADGASALCISGDIVNSECDDATDCAGGQGFVCTRTLEQLAESPDDEPLVENQGEEPGWCRTVSAPECAEGEQEGCRTEAGCSASGLTQLCSMPDGRCYCCDTPTSGSGLNVHIYAEADATGTSAACVECPDSACETETCTVLMDPACVVPGGSVCGCTPPT